MEVKGHVDTIIFQNETSGWGIARLIIEDNKFLTIKGVFDFLEGDFIECEGDFVNDQKYGEQLVVKNWRKIVPEKKEDIIRYLGSGIFTGIGKKTAEKIYDFFGEKIFDIFDKNIGELVNIPGITEEKIKIIENEWKEQKKHKEAYIFFRQFNLPFSLINKIIEQYEEEAIDRVKKDPYLLVDYIEGVGFKTADKIALKMGMSKKSPERILAGIFYVLRLMLLEGDTFINKKELIIITSHTLEISGEDDFINDCIEVLINENHLKEVEDKIFLKKCYYAEKNIAEFIVSKVNKKGIDLKDIKQLINSQCEINDIELSEEQKNAVEGIITSPISVLTGGAGVGKTTTVRLLLNLLESSGKEILLTTPTGRASQRLKEVTGQSVKTIHRLLQWDFEEKGFIVNKDNPLKGDFLIVDEASMIDIFLMDSLLKAVPRDMQVLFIGDTEQLPSVGPGRVLSSIIDSEVVLVTELTKIYRQAESSEIIKSSHSIRNGIVPDVKNIMDIPSSELKTVDCVMVDAINVDKEEVDFVFKYKKELLKFRKDNKINKKKTYLPDSWRKYSLKKKELLIESEVNEVLNMIKNFPIEHPQIQLGYSIEDYLSRLIKNMIPFIRNNSSEEIQILSPMKKGVLGTKNLNKIVQELKNPKSQEKDEMKYGDKFFREGDRVIQTKNDYERNVFNGDIGYIKSIKRDNLIVEFKEDDQNIKKVVYEKKDFENLDLAYAITIHKSQGSEFDIVIIPIFLEQHIMLYRQLIYTAITRGKKYVVLFGEKEAVKKAVNNKDNSERKTFLKNFLIEGLSI